MNQREEEEKNNKKKKRALITSFIIAFLGVVFFHLRLGTGRLGFMELMSVNGQWTWGYTVLLVALFFIFFVIAFLFSKGIFKIKREHEYSEDEKKKRKEFRVELIFVTIDLLMTGLFVNYNWKQITSAGLLLGIAEVAAFFAIVWMGFELFNRFSFLPKKIFAFITGFLIKICVPMLFLLIIMLGAYQAKYSYTDTFRESIWNNSMLFGDNMRLVYFNLVTTLYNVGQANPDLWVWLPIAAFVLMTLWLLISTFTKKEKEDHEKTAQEIMDEAMKEDAEEQAYERGEKKRPLTHSLFKRLGDKMKSKKEKEAELKEKEDEKNVKYNIYDAKLIVKQVKGGKTDK